METTNMKAAIARAEELFEKMPPSGRRWKGAAFTSLARSAFEKIFKARAEGFSFVQICAVFEQVGLLPEKARPNSLRQAFYREVARRKKVSELSRRILTGVDTERKHSVAPVRRDERSTVVETDEERLKRLTGVVVNSRNGTIIKHTDGSFEF